MKKIILLVWLAVLPALSADEFVTNAQGDLILLKDNGTWEKVIVRQTVSGPDFRYACWGMPFFEVKGLEEAALVYQKQHTVLGYEALVGGYACSIFYQFSGSMLVSSSYHLHENFTGRLSYVDAYDRYKATLNERYGEPVKDEVSWKNNPPAGKRERAYWGDALAAGNLSLRTTWETEQTTISLSCRQEPGYNLGIGLSVYYASINLIRMTTQNTTVKQKEFREL